MPDCLDFASLPDEPGVYLFRNATGQNTYVGKSVSLRTRARAHFAAAERGAGWTQQAALVDHRTTNSELGALVLEHRLIRELRPPGNVVHKRDDAFVYLRCRLDIAYPVLEIAREPASGRSVTIGRCAAARRRSSSRSSSTRCSGCATAAVRCGCGRGRRRTGRWAAACRRA